jgi:hypothetical protein
VGQRLEAELHSEHGGEDPQHRAGGGDQDGDASRQGGETLTEHPGPGYRRGQGDL